MASPDQAQPLSPVKEDDPVPAEHTDWHSLACMDVFSSLDGEVDVEPKDQPLQAQAVVKRADYLWEPGSVGNISFPPLLVPTLSFLDHNLQLFRRFHSATR
jgi:hypothetical protein